MISLSQLSDAWDEKFMQEFVSVRRNALRGYTESLPETIEDLRLYFDPSQAFAREHHFRAWIAHRNGKAVARGASFVPRAWKVPPFLPFGFFEFVDDAEAARAVLERARDFGRSLSIAELRAPIDASFFGSYRLVTESRGPCLYGEPRRPDHYLRIYSEIGLEAYKHWTTFRVPVKDFLASAEAIRSRFYPEGLPGELRFRSISGATWSEDVDTVHRLFTASYASMSEYMPISVEAFRELYGSFRYIVDPRYSRILYRGNEAIAFFAGYHDPFRALAPVKRAAVRAPNFLGPLFSIAGLARLKLVKGGPLAPYVGKDPKADEVRGAMALLMREFAVNIPPDTDDFLGVYVADGSPSLKTLPESREALTRYAMFRLKI